ncbi:hypothetical protein A2U01_0063608, partial [Trifolium medium]|nr:hypothetical protein [Trifolium medium]
GQRSPGDIPFLQARCALHFSPGTLKFFDLVSPGARPAKSREGN